MTTRGELETLLLVLPVTQLRLLKAAVTSLGVLQAQMISSQPTARQSHLAACLEKLMTDVQRNLEAKNRDKFTQV